MVKIRICSRCGKKVEKIDNKIKYCDDCREQIKKENKRKRNEYFKKYSQTEAFKQRRKEREERYRLKRMEGREKKCITCGSETESFKRKYCSECLRKRANERNKIRSQNLTPEQKKARLLRMRELFVVNRERIRESQRKYYNKIKTTEEYKLKQKEYTKRYLEKKKMERGNEDE